MVRPTSESPSTREGTGGTKVRNLLVAIAAILVSIALFLGLHNQTTKPSLNTLAASSVPLEVALSNPNPTLIEFYANWCTSCQAMAADLMAIKDTYSNQVNFVMLNVDNSKWLPEILQYRVDGIPHFVFVNAAGEAVASTIGQQPRPILAENLEALVANQPLPHQFQGGLTSTFSPKVKPQDDDPRSHGGRPTT
ncbi:thioredoxin fold domain-containing protein [Synechococcales cyanobacterium C]|uniref:Thioredoxin fold domain-containing protein n=1 Tax=Petrachloros mirabilis ULC683 TaxID=2781853 RepID=A0A8K2A1F7_9CYAN|nr:thioredoxin family protein [Petrachloros mirabilis]NCJ07883.1 thioredoxin fold domain-containing protein [Petrachloros mirabilis ULC683]